MKDILQWVVFGGLFLVPLLTLNVASDSFFPFITGKNFLFRIVVDVVVVAWVVLAFFEPRYRPRWSWIVGGAGSLLAVMFVANALGENPSSSFWSNFERMDGYVSLVHTYLYMLVLGSVLQTEQHWQRLFNTSLVVAILVAVGGLAQYFEWSSVTALFGINADTTRIDSTLGNAAYMAVYMLFHVFIAVWLLVKTSSLWLRGVYIVSLPLFVFVLLETGTRGTAVALVSGALVTTAYLAICARELPTVRRYATVGLCAVVLLSGGFFAAKDTSFVQGQPNLARIANISLEELEVRSMIWGVAWEGIKERPLLGWGQENFSYVFNERYDPRLYNQEQWFDRAHNVFMDWLIAGGILGLIAYLSIFAACLYYLVVQPLLDRNKKPAFTVLERGLLLGVLAGYMTHNLVVFDNIISYIFFAIILGLIHARVSVPVRRVAEQTVDESVIKQVIAPTAVATLLAVIFFVHMPGMAAAQDLITAFRSLQPGLTAGTAVAPVGPSGMLQAFEQAFDRDSFAQQEIVEQFAQNAQLIARQTQIPATTRESFADAVEMRLDQLIAEQPNDARVRVFAADYYQSTGDIERAVLEADRARELAPTKQSVIMQQAFIELARDEYAAARAFFLQAYELESAYTQPAEYAVIAAIRQGDQAEVIALISSFSPETTAAVVRSEPVVEAARADLATDVLTFLYQSQSSLRPDDAQPLASLAFLSLTAGDRLKAVEYLQLAASADGSFATTANCISANISNRMADPQAGC